MSETAAPEPLVSVVIPVYNAAKYLRETLDYVCNQTLRNIEIICVDDGSTDDSPGILQEYAAKDARLRILQQQNQYAGVARNNGMAAASGKYMVFWDSDDIFLPEMLEKLYNRAEETEADLVCCNAMGRDDTTGKTYDMPWILPYAEGQQFSPYLFNPVQDAPGEVFKYSGSVPWNKLYKRSFVEQFHITWLNTQSSNDMTFVCHCMALARKVSLLDEVLMYYRERQDSIWHSKSKSPASMYEAHAELLRRMKKCGMPEKVIEGVYLHMLVEMPSHLSADRCDNPTERAALYVNEYEPLFGLFRQESSTLRNHPAYVRLKAYAEPTTTVLVALSKQKRGIRECIDSLSNDAVEIVFDVTDADPETSAYAKLMARQYFWVRTSTRPIRPKARITAKLSPGRFLAPPVNLGNLLNGVPEGAALNMDPISRRYCNCPQFYICTPKKHSWRLFGLPLLTITYDCGEAHVYIFGKHIATRKLQKNTQSACAL